MKIKQTNALSGRTWASIALRRHSLNLLSATGFGCLLLFSSLAISAEEGEVKTVEISADDTMRYDPAGFEVKAGQRVRIVLKNVGKLPKIAMGHNLIVLKEGAKMAEFAQAALTAKDSGYIPESKRGETIAYTKLLGPGESDSIEFSAPEKPGKYEYFCSFPGHWALMKGVITVK